MSTLKYTPQDYYSEDSNSDGTGYYQYTTMVEMIDDFMVTKVGGNKLIKSIDKHEVEWHTRRGIQEFNFDVLKPISSWSENLNGRLSIPYPQDLVNIIQVSWIDGNGYERTMEEEIHSSNANEPLKDNDGNYLYDDDGNLMFANNSSGLDAWQNKNGTEANYDSFYNYYAGSFETPDLYDRYYNYYGRRYGSTPETTNVNGTYVIDDEAGVIFFDMAVSGKDIQIKYVSDGNGVDINKIRVHKFAEDAIYDYVKWKILSDSSDVPQNRVLEARREFYAAKKRAKLRLLKIDPQNLFRTMKGMTKWIKN